MHAIEWAKLHQLKLEEYDNHQSIKQNRRSPIKLVSKIQPAKKKGSQGSLCLWSRKTFILYLTSYAGVGGGVNDFVFNKLRASVIARSNCTSTPLAPSVKSSLTSISGSTP